MKQLLLATLLFLSIFASAQNQRVRFESDAQIPLSEIFRQIEGQTNMTIAYNENSIDTGRIVSVSAGDKTLGEVMNRVLAGTGMTIKIQGNIIALVQESKEHEYTGVVKDAIAPIVGAVLTVQGSNTVAMTDIDGKFSVKANEGSILKVSILGYNEVEIILGSKFNNIDITLTEDTQLLDEVVVVGFGTTKKVNLTGAVSVIKADELEDRSALSVSRMLQGSVPGLNITNRSGRPGQAATINIRGLNSINGGSPLILIDGAEGDLERINPADIESISVIKDASSAAIYGARASFGVILVTTKVGADKNGKPVVRYSGRAGFTSPTTSTDFETRGYYSVYLNNLFYEAYAGVPYAPYSDEDMMELWARRHDKVENPARPWVTVTNKNGMDVYNYYANTDWYHELYNDLKPTTSHSVSFSGGTEKVKYMLSGSYNMETGTFRINPDKFSKYNLRAKLSFDVTKWLNISSNTSYYASDYTYPGRAGVNNSFRMAMVHGLASYPAVNPDGTAVGNTQYRSESVMDGLMVMLNNGHHKNQDKANHFSTMTEATITPFKNLEVKANFTYNHTSAQSMNRQTNGEYSVNPGVISTLTTGYWQDKLTETISFHNYKQFNVYATYHNQFGKGHNFKVMAGYTYETKHLKDVTASGENLMSNTLNDLNLVGTNADGQKVTNVGGGQNEYAIESVFARFNYDYKERYLFEFNGRYDGTSRFSADSRWGFFPSASAGWRISEEPFFERAKAVGIDNLKLRFSYGRLGNQQVGYYDYIRGINIGTLSYLFGDAKPIYATIDAPVSGNLTWEVIDQYNVGLDYAMFGNRLSFTAEAYIRDTKGMLTKGIALPGVYGATPPKMNAADMRTKGYELSLSWRDQFKLAGRPFSYSASVVFSDYITKITKFDNPEKVLSNYYVGQTYGEIWGYETAGYFTSDEEAKNWHIDQSAVSNIIYSSAGAEYGLRVGDLKYVDQPTIDTDGDGIPDTGDGKISIGANTLDNHGDLKKLGNTQPRYQYGINLGASWLGFDFSIFLQGVGHMDWYPDPEAELFWGPYSRPYATFIPADFMNKMWSEENPNSYFPRPRGYIAMKKNRTLGAVNDRYLQNIGYCRLKNLTFGYTIPESIMEKAHISQLRVFFSGENLAYMSPLKKNTRYIDPEQAATGGNLSVYPWQKTFMFGIDLTF